MPTANWSKALFVSSLVGTSLTASSAIAGTVLYATLYLGAFAATVPDDTQDTLAFWDEHAQKNMITVFICVEVMVSRCWSLYEFFRVLRTEALGSAVEQRKWAITTLWVSVLLALALDVATHTFLSGFKEDLCSDVSSREVRLQRSLQPLCAQSNDNETLISSLHYGNTGTMVMSAVLLTADTIQQSNELKEASRSALDVFLDHKALTKQH